MMARLEIFQSLWALSEPSRVPPSNCKTEAVPSHCPMPPSISEQLHRVERAGFAGVDVVYGDFPDQQIADLLADCQLASTVTAFPDSVDALLPAIDLAVSLQARHLNVIGKVYPMDIASGARYVEGWMLLCEQAGLPLTIETHRDCLTTDLHYVLQLLEAVPQMRLSADLSHFVVGREFGWPISAAVQSQVCTVLQRSDALQGRIASREQIQLPVEFPQHQKWVDVFTDWWSYGIENWLQRSDANATLNFLCELGPPEYAMTDANGFELSDRWHDALLIKQIVEQLWEEKTAVRHQASGPEIPGPVNI